jgi:DNA-binding LacI/PurR family transcriptional regulator
MARKNVTLRDVAERAGVSVATVSRLLNDRELAVQVSDETRNRVLEATRVLGYRPNRLARALVTEKKNIIGLSFPMWRPVELISPYFHMSHSASIGALIDGVQTVTFPRGYEVLLIERCEFESVARGQSRMASCLDLVDGLIYATPNPAFDQYSPVLDQGVPLVMLGRVPNGPEVSCVRVDNAAEMNRVAQALIRKGHRRIALILPMERTAPLSVFLAQGYRQALTSASVPLDESLVLEGGFEDKWGQHTANRLLAMPNPPTAIIVGRSDLAVDVLGEVKLQGRRCPDDIEIVVWGDEYVFESTDPSLTAVGGSFSEIGQRAAELLLDMVEGKVQEPKEVRIRPFYKERGSCHLDLT